MKTKAKSVQVFVVNLWSKDHYNDRLTKLTNIYSGQITDAKTKEAIFFDNAAEFLSIIDKLYRKAEKELKQKK